MASGHILQVLRQGIWASLTGGWFYDPRQTLFCNTLQMYIWLLLLLLPLVLSICFDFATNRVVSVVYVVVIAVLFTVIKAVVWYLHYVFDTCDCVEEEIPVADPADDMVDPLVGRIDARLELSPLSRDPREVLSVEPAMRPDSVINNSDEEMSVGHKSIDLKLTADVHAKAMVATANSECSSSSSSDSTSPETSVLIKPPRDLESTLPASILHISKSESRIAAGADPMYKAPHSLFERTRNTRSAGGSVLNNGGDLLSDESLRTCRKPVRKSYPGQSSSSVDTFLNNRPLVRPTSDDRNGRGAHDDIDDSSDSFRQSHVTGDSRQQQHQPSASSGGSSASWRLPNIESRERGGSLPLSPVKGVAASMAKQRPHSFRNNSIDVRFSTIPEPDHEEADSPDAGGSPSPPIPVNRRHTLIELAVNNDASPTPVPPPMKRQSSLDSKYSTMRSTMSKLTQPSFETASESFDKASTPALNDFSETGSSPMAGGPAAGARSSAQCHPSVKLLRERFETAADSADGSDEFDNTARRTGSGTVQKTPPDTSTQQSSNASTPNLRSLFRSRSPSSQRMDPVSRPPDHQQQPSDVAKHNEAFSDFNSLPPKRNEASMFNDVNFLLDALENFPIVQEVRPEFQTFRDKLKLRSEGTGGSCSKTVAEVDEMLEEGPSTSSQTNQGASAGDDAEPPSQLRRARRIPTSGGERHHRMGARQRRQRIRRGHSNAVPSSSARGDRPAKENGPDGAEAGVDVLESMEYFYHDDGCWYKYTLDGRLSHPMLVTEQYVEDKRAEQSRAANQRQKRPRGGSSAAASSAPVTFELGSEINGLALKSVGPHGFVIDDDANDVRFRRWSRRRSSSSSEENIGHPGLFFHPRLHPSSSQEPDGRTLPPSHDYISALIGDSADIDTIHPRAIRHRRQRRSLVESGHDSIMPDQANSYIDVESIYATRYNSLTRGRMFIEPPLPFGSPSRMPLAHIKEEVATIYRKRVYYNVPIPWPPHCCFPCSCQPSCRKVPKMQENVEMAQIRPATSTVDHEKGIEEVIDDTTDDLAAAAGQVIAPKKWTFKLHFDRLQLTGLFDRNRRKLSCVLDVILATVVSIFASIVLSSHYYSDFWSFLFCFVVASAQFSLLRSVQPDAASPIHGFNWLVSYNRPVYFCICAAVILLLDSILGSLGESWVGLELYRIDVVSYASVSLAKSALMVIFLCFPLIFTFGLLPQISTFAMHVCEQLDMLLFGGTATISLASAIFALSRSLLSVVIVSGFARLAVGDDPANNAQSVLFSLYCSILIVCSFNLSRSTSNVALLYRLVKRSALKCARISQASDDNKSNQTIADSLELKFQSILCVRFMADVLSTCLMCPLFFGLHCSTLFSIWQPNLDLYLAIIIVNVGFVLHYLWPHLRKFTPWKFLASSVLRTHEAPMFEVSAEARLMWFERTFIWGVIIEKYALYTLLMLSLLTKSAPDICNLYGLWTGAVVMSVCGMKILRDVFCQSTQVYFCLFAAVLLTRFDAPWTGQPLLVNMYVLVVIFPKLKELMLKLHYVFAYIAPWQITWGSAFHAIAQPFSVPHSAFLLVQAFLSSLVSAPLQPFLGSAVFLTSYMRPLKFWEKDYNTRRLDNTQTRLANQLDRNASDDNNLNSIFYEHLTRSLQHHLCGDLQLGRWASSIEAGDCFFLANNNLNCLVHLIEVGNGFVTFQVRGLEFRGTYCHQREVEAITEHFNHSGCCCFDPGHLPGFLSFNGCWGLRWMTWEVMVDKYVLEAYSISDISAQTILAIHELRQSLITLFVKCIVYYAIRSPSLEVWLQDEAVQKAIKSVLDDKKYTDLDPQFSYHFDVDYDGSHGGVSFAFFKLHFENWIKFCASRRENGILGTRFAEPSLASASKKSKRESKAARQSAASTTAQPHRNDQKESIFAFCYILSLVGRRTLMAAAHNRLQSVESFCYGLYALFKNDFRVTCGRDEWIFTDSLEIIRTVLSPAVKMALKLHQDTFAHDEYSENPELYRAVVDYEQSLFISHEGDPAWREAVIQNVPSLLTLRHVTDEGLDEYKIVMLNKRFLSFRVIKLNRENVRGLWAGQVQEQVFLRNRNPERGSIQNAKQVLRNIINSSADQPIGYPIYVSPLITSFVETHDQVWKTLGPSITFHLLWQWLKSTYQRLCHHCGMTCSSSGNVTSSQPTLVSVQPGGPVRSLVTEEVEMQNLGVPRTSGSAVSTTVQQHAHITTTASVSPSDSYRTSVGTPRSGGRSRVPSANVQRSNTHPVTARRPVFNEHGDDISVGNVKLSSARDSIVSGSGSQITVTLVDDSEPTTGAALPAASTSKPKKPPKNSYPQKVQVVGESHIFTRLNQARHGGKTVVVWPDETWKTRGGQLYWASNDIFPRDIALGMEGLVVHKWTPFNPEEGKRSHIDKTILLVEIKSGNVTLYVPVTENGVKYLEETV